jgi:hypothetical protein
MQLRLTPTTDVIAVNQLVKFSLFITVLSSLTI